MQQESSPKIGGSDLKPNVKPKVLITERMPLFDEEKRLLEPYASVELLENSIEEDLVSAVENVDVMMVVYAKITEKVLDSAKKLKGIVRYGIGYDNIDIGAATERKIPVANVPDYCIATVAEHTFALLLALSRKIVVADKAIRTSELAETWTSPPMKIMGIELEGKNLGLLGLGQIGKAVARRAKSFGMIIRAYDPYLDKTTADSVGADLVTVEKLLRISDFVSIHVPLSDETRGMIGETEFRVMKKNAYIINVSRGPIIDEKALYNALKQGLIAGAALDVYQEEPPNPKNPLFDLENVVLTPHTAWYTKEALHRLETSAVNEAIRLLNGEFPKNLVNRELLRIS